MKKRSYSIMRNNSNAFLHMLIILILSLIIFTCDLPNSQEPEPVQGTVSLTLPGSNELQKTIEPDIGMVISHYTISGSGPDSESFLQENIETGSTFQISLTPGDWTIIAEGLNSNGTKIGEGLVTVSIFSGQVSEASITISPLTAQGYLGLDVSWPDGIFTTPLLTGTITPSGGSSQSMDFSYAGDSLSASYGDSLNAGYYQIEMNISDNGSVVWGRTEAARIVAGATTSSSYVISADTTTSVSREAYLWEPIEWSIENSSYSGNPFDLVATVTFEHQESSKTHTTQMYYSGNNKWKFRFTGTAIGDWTYSTSSSDPELDSQTGAVKVLENPNPEQYGFIKSSTIDPRKWARIKGNAATEETFVPQIVMWREGINLTSDQSIIESDIQTFIIEHGFNGLHAPIMLPDVWTDTNNNPRMSTFDKLELLITNVHANGGFVHLWIWGDAQRGWTPPGGVNSSADKRLQRYIAARLGPLPGWTVSYGFDLWEWVTGEELTEWHNYMHQHFGWPHMLGARSSKNQLDQLSENMDYSAYEQHEPDYDMYIQTINARPDKPSISEDRFRVTNNGDGKDYTLNQTRRGLYHSTMGGGVANIWGNLEDGGSYGYGSAPYPNKNEIKTYSTFFFTNNRFLPYLEPNSTISDGYALQSNTNNQYIFYKEATTTIQINLSNMSVSKPAVAVDTKSSYQEIDLGNLETISQTITLPHASDWIIAVGEF